MLANACQTGAWVVPLFVDYGDEISLVEFAEPTRVADADAAHHIGEVIAAMGNRQRGMARVTHPDVERFRGQCVLRADLRAGPGLNRRRTAP